MNKLKIILFIILSYFLYLNNATFAAINFTVSPPLYEIDAFTGTTVSRTALLRNNSEIPVNIITGKTDFQSNGNSGVPQFVRYSELVHPDQQLSTWINLDTASFTINPNEEKTINFTLTVPNDASPGGHYGAVCFKNNKSENPTSGSTNIDINIDYCILMLVNVDGEVITNAVVKDTVINLGAGAGGGGKGNGKNDLVKDDCPIIDLTASNFDGKCIDNFFKNDNLKDDINKLNLNENSDVTKDDFDISFNTPIVNEGNTHLSPKGSITLVDQNGNIIKGIGKESVKSEDGAKIGDKIVDYLPINDEGGNVLPGQTRDFNAEWKGFPYESYDELGKKVIKYWTPEEYYTKKNMSEGGYIFPWQRINERINIEKIKANVNLSYKNKDGENVEFNSADEFNVKYKEKYVGTNPYAVICFIIFILVIYILWLIFRKKKIKCISCKKKIEKDMVVCPYCGIKQDDKRFKKFNNQENSIKNKHLKQEEHLKYIHNEQEDHIKHKHIEQEEHVKHIHEEQEEHIINYHDEQKERIIHKIKEKGKEKNVKGKK